MPYALIANPKAIGLENLVKRQIMDIRVSIGLAAAILSGGASAMTPTSVFSSSSYSQGLVDDLTGSALHSPLESDWEKSKVLQEEGITEEEANLYNPQGESSYSFSRSSIRSSASHSVWIRNGFVRSFFMQ